MAAHEPGIKPRVLVKFVRVPASNGKCLCLHDTAGVSLAGARCSGVKVPWNRSRLWRSVRGPLGYPRQVGWSCASMRRLSPWLTSLSKGWNSTLTKFLAREFNLRFFPKAAANQSRHSDRATHLRSRPCRSSSVGRALVEVPMVLMVQVLQAILRSAPLIA